MVNYKLGVLLRTITKDLDLAL